jgi:inositol-phosphate phosphatase/L-galactose 1-phosphate phosphatase/histidinol-phosphatase
MASAASGVPPEAIELAGRLADAAGAVIRQHFRSPVEVEDKPDQSPVTIADRGAEAAMRQLIEATFPEHGIYGEEYGVERGDAEHVWVLDPIDGTKSFISGVPLFGTLIALLHQGRPVLGVLDQPILGERWLGIDGVPTSLNGRTIRTRSCAALDRATLFSTTPELFAGADKAAFERVRAAAKLTRYGTDCYAFGLVAAGFVDLVLEVSLKLYDFAALVPIVTGAGGSLTDWRGGALRAGSDGRVLASGDARVAAAVLELIG